MAVLTEESFGSRQRVTMDDVARRAGVSRALVSIVMREAPGASEEKRRRVLAAAAELGYRPDVRAQSLAGQRSRVIGVMFGVTVGAFHFELLDGLFAAAESHGHNLIISPADQEPGRGHGGPLAAGFPVRRVDHAQPTDRAPAAGRSDPPGGGGLARRSSRGSTSCGPMTSRGSDAPSTTWSRLGHRDIAHIDGGDT